MTVQIKKPITTDMTITELYKAFDRFNELYFDNSLPKPYIVILETKRQKAYGWFTPSKIWMSKYDSIEPLHEIAMSAEYMSRGFYNVVQTLLHELVHLYCHTVGKKDMEGKKFHNRTFKLECMKRGFYFDESPHQVHGWYNAKLTDKAKEKIKNFGLNENAFSIARVVNKKKPKNYTAKYKCFDCNVNLRGKKGLRIICCECGKMMCEC